MLGGMKPPKSADCLNSLVAAVLTRYAAPGQSPLGVDANLYRAWSIGRAIRRIRDAGKANEDGDSGLEPRFDYHGHTIFKLAAITMAEIGIGRIYLYRAIAAAEQWSSERKIPRGVSHLALHYPKRLRCNSHLNLSGLTHREVVVRIADALLFELESAACEVPALWSALDGLNLGVIGIGTDSRNLSGAVIIGALCTPMIKSKDSRNPKVVAAEKKAKAAYAGDLEDRIVEARRLVAERIKLKPSRIGGVIAVAKDSEDLVLRASRDSNKINQKLHLPRSDKIKAVLKSERWPLVPAMPGRA